MTAPNIVFNALRDADLPNTLRVHRAEIADRGRLGLLSIEGHGPNPRLWACGPGVTPILMISAAALADVMSALSPDEPVLLFG